MARTLWIVAVLVAILVAPGWFKKGGDDKKAVASWVHIYDQSGNCWYSES